MHPNSDIAPAFAELAGRRRWCWWRQERRDGRATKVPYAASGGHASVTNAQTWAPYAEVTGRGDGPGIFLGRWGDGRWLVGVDLDMCFADDGTLEEWAAAIVSKFATYAEISPSGNGIKIYGWCEQPVTLRRNKITPRPRHNGEDRDAEIALYVDARYFCVTGRTWGDYDMVGGGRRQRDWFAPSAAALHTTSDFPAILGDAAQRSLLDFYKVAESPLKQVARRNDLADFREAQRVRLGEAPALAKVLEAGEVTRGPVSEASETIKLDSFARIFGLSRQAIVNDDLSAFSDQLRWWGQAAASLEATQLVAALSTVMSDTKALFHADHGNLAGSGAAISVTTISAGRLAMRTQKGVGGVEIVGAAPKFLLTGPAKETIAQQVVTTITPAVVAEANPFAGTLAVLCEPRISGNEWYLFCDPAVLPSIEYAYLSQQPGPTLVVREGFDILGSEYRLLLDFAASAIDWRGCYKNPGA